MASIQDLITATPSISARPDAVVSMLEIIDDPAVGADKLLPVVERDPGLAAGLLKLCNSPLYGFKRIIGAPREALVMVGNATFARLCFTLSLKPVLHRDLPGYQLDLDTLWQHSLATAYGSAFLVKAMGLSELHDRAFTAGLLHDIGKLVLDHELAASATASAEESAAGAAVVVPHTEVTRGQERRCTGYTHAEAGAALLDSWDLPETIVAAVRFHHEPSVAAEYRRIALAVNVANRVSHVAGKLKASSTGLEQWVAKTFDGSTFAPSSIQDLAETLSNKHQNILALAMNPRV